MAGRGSRWKRLLALISLATGFGCAQAQVVLLPPEAAQPESSSTSNEQPDADATPALTRAPAPTAGPQQASTRDTKVTRASDRDAKDTGVPGAQDEPSATAIANSAQPGFSDELRLGTVTDTFRPSGPTAASEAEVTDLSPPRAERAGAGGGPTRKSAEKDEADDEDEEEFPKSNLLNRALGLEDSPVKVFGWIEGSYTANPGQPKNGVNFGVFPNNHSNSWMFNQIYFVVEKTVEKSDEINFGFRVDNMLGTDWQVGHDLGLFNRSFRPNGFGYDFPQLYGEVHLPIPGSDGIDIKGGRFYALPGYEDLAAPGRPLLSTAYMFSFAQPITHIGVMSTWHATDQINVYNGVVNGWDRWIDVHNRWGYAGAVAWDSKDESTNVTATLNFGPNQPNHFLSRDSGVIPIAVTQPPFLAGRLNPAARDSDATLFTLVLSHDWTKAWHTIAETNLGFENNVPGAGFGGTTQNASWYGLAGWLLYDFIDTLTGVARAEVFRDNNGILTGFSDNFYETTLGLIYKPKPWLWARPEIRYDWSQFTHPYDAGTAKNQLTFGFDLLFLF